MNARNFLVANGDDCESADEERLINRILLLINETAELNAYQRDHVIHAIRNYVRNSEGRTCMSVEGDRVEDCVDTDDFLTGMATYINSCR